MWIMMKARNTPESKHSKEDEGLLKLLDDFIEKYKKDPTDMLLRFWRDQAIVTTADVIHRWINLHDIPYDDLSNIKNDYTKMATEQLQPKLATLSCKVVIGHPSFKWNDGHHPNIFGEQFVYNPQRNGMTYWLENHTAELVTRCTDSQKQAIRDIISYGIQNKNSTAEVARMIRPTIGLTSRQATANARYYNRIKSQLLSDHPRMKAENAEKKARQKANVYAKKQLKYRAETIARTELANVYNEGVYRGVSQAITDGYMHDVQKTWVTARGPNVCPYCSQMEGKTIRYEDEFEVPNFGYMDGPIAHPRCQCVLKYTSQETNNDDEESEEEEE